jgi:MFS family permease
MLGHLSKDQPKTSISDMVFNDHNQFNMKKFNLLLFIKLLVFFDFFAVSLVVPLLSSYFRDAGIDTKLYGLISSLYSLSQLVGGIIIGFLSDHISKQEVLLLSFVGSAISYLIVGTSHSIFLLFGSRILVGLVKQTISISTSVITELTQNNAELRAKELGQMSSISTAVFIGGPSIGSLIYKYDKRLPALTACLCFVVNIFICYYFCKDEEILVHRKIHTIKKSIESEGSSKYKDRILSFIHMSKEIFIIPHLKEILICKLFYAFLAYSMSSRHILNYFEAKFHIETYMLGFMTSASMTISIIVKSFLIVPILQLSSYLQRKSNRNVTVIHWDIFLLSMIILLLSSVFEYSSDSYNFYLITVLLPHTVASTLLQTILTTTFTDIVPVEHIGKAQGIYGVFTSAIGVIGPLYGSQVFEFFGGIPNKPLVEAGHYIIGVVIIGILMIFSTPLNQIEENQNLKDEIIDYDEDDPIRAEYDIFNTNIKKKNL